MLTHNLHNFSELEDRIALLHMQQKEVNTSVVSLESQIRHLREMLKYAKQYQKNKIYDDHYKSSKDPDRYFRKYESQIILFAGAEHILQENGIDLKHLNSNKLHEQIANLISRVIIHKFILSLLPIRVYRIFEHTLITIHCIFLNLHS